MVLTLVKINESYSQGNRPVLVPIRGGATQTSGDMCKEKRKHQFKMLRPKRNLFTFCICPDVYAGPSRNKQLIKELQAPAPGRSRFGDFIIIPCNSKYYSKIASLLHNVFILKTVMF